MNPEHQSKKDENKFKQKKKTSYSNKLIQLINFKEESRLRNFKNAWAKTVVKY